MTLVLDKPAPRTDAATRAQSAARPAVSLSCRVGLRERLAVLRQARMRIASEPDAFVKACRLPWRKRDAETLLAEVMPLCDAMRWLEKHAARTLRDRRVGLKGRPMTSWGVRSGVRREPVGRVLVIGPGNYPLLLPGVQAVQAYAAGNRVSIKPAPGSRAVMERLVKRLRDAGMEFGAIEVLAEDPAEASAKIEAGEVDKVFFTGSDRSGRAVMRQLADHGIPSVMELSGCDAMLVLEDADMDRVIAALRMGLRFNASQTCIAPRRVLVHEARYDELCRRIAEVVRGIEPADVPTATVEMLDGWTRDAESGGARRLSGQEQEIASPMPPLVLADVSPSAAIADADVFAPVVSLMRCAGEEAMLDAYAQCGYRLGASVFGKRNAGAIADKLDAGHVVVNDLIDMRQTKHRRDIEDRFRENLKRDRARTRILPISQFGILEMTRQRMRPSLKKSIYTDCAGCHGAGMVRSPESVVLDVMRQLQIA
ncbi:MAG: aldehyde dehydrogenase family protein, partial [Phycisphaeraceae bacterium]